jgi:hypothetical protein
MATVYHRDDAGAPTYAMGSILSSNTMHFEAVRTILKACLVSGYDSRPAAGWTLVAESTNYLVLRNGALSGYVCLTWVGTGYGYIDVYVAETFTGMSSNYMTGDGLKSGIAANNAAPQRIALGPYVYNTAVHTWTLIADSRTFVINLCSVQNSTPAEVTGAAGSAGTWSSLLYVGEDSAGNFVSAGGQNTTSTSPVNYFGLSGGTALKDPRTGLLIGAGALPDFVVFSSQVTQARTEIVPILKTALSRSIWGFNGGLGGYLRGVALPVDVFAHFPSKGAQSLGLAVVITSRNVNTPIDLGDGFTYFPTAYNYQSAFRLLTNNPEFW